MSSKIKVDTIENVAGSGNVSLGSGHNLVVPGTLAITGASTLTGATTIGGDLTVDTSTFKVDATNNRVGIGVTSPSRKLELNNGGTGFLATFTDGVATNFTFKTDGNQVGTFGTEAGSTHLGFMASGTERVRIHSSGVMSVNNGIELGSGLDATAANVLDDYEFGAWTPTTPNAGSVTTGQGRYVKVGKMVTVWCYVQTISNTSSSNAFDIGGLPFTAIGTGTMDSTVGPVMIRYVDDNASEPLTITSYISGGGTSLLFYVSRGNTDSYGRVLHSHFNNANIGLRTQLSYEVS